MDFTIGFYMKFCIKMVSFIKIGPFLNSAALGGLGGKMAAPGRRRRLERAAWCQNVRTNILVTGKKNGAVFEQSKIFPPYPYEGLKHEA